MSVLLCGDFKLEIFKNLFNHYNLNLKTIAINDDLPGSFWKEPEAGLVGNTLYIRNDTPVHSALHEACHYICMDSDRRQSLHTDAGGGYEEEDAVCFLQIVLAETMPEMGRERMLSDMDQWGYTFRLGSAQKWFEQDADDARQWLLDKHILDKDEKPTWQVRQNK